MRELVFVFLVVTNFATENVICINIAFQSEAFDRGLLSPMKIKLENNLMRDEEKNVIPAPVLPTTPISIAKIKLNHKS